MPVHLASASQALLSHWPLSQVHTMNNYRGSSVYLCGTETPNVSIECTYHDDPALDLPAASPDERRSWVCRLACTGSCLRPGRRSQCCSSSDSPHRHARFLNAALCRCGLCLDHGRRHCQCPIACSTVICSSKRFCLLRWAHCCKPLLLFHLHPSREICMYPQRMYSSSREAYPPSFGPKKHVARLCIFNVMLTCTAVQSFLSE